MRHLNKALLIGSLALTSLPACAGHRESAYEYAKVVDARPVYATVRYPVDEEVCWDELAWRREPAVHSATPTILGAIIGGVVGHGLGHGHHRGATTVAGVALGSSIGYDISQQRHPDSYYTETQKRCEIQRSWRTEETISGWDVTYRYHGEIYQTRMHEEPGDRIRVLVQVQPVRR
jgi:uncharacterized protein YcfJ